MRKLSGDELRTRLGQAISKRTDYGRSRLGSDFGGSAKGDGLEGRFLFDPSDVSQITAAIRDHLPQVHQEILARASRICEHKFDLLGYTGLDYGKDIDWHCDAVSRKRAPLRPWYKIAYLDYQQVGDAKVTWELNRHQHLVVLAKAYLLSGDGRYRDEISNQWYSWRGANPYPIGINWASSLEVAFRSLAWLWVRALLRPSPGIPNLFREDLDHELRVNGRHLERYLSTYFSPNTHLMGEGVALFFIGTLVSSPSSERWKRLGWEIVLGEAQRQVQADGFHFEQSTYYHVYSIDFFLHSYLLALANSMDVPDEFPKTIVRMLEALASLSQGGLPPRFGDDDGGRLFDGQRNRPEHLVDPLSVGAVVFDRPDFRFPGSQLTEETLWLLGPNAAEKFARLQSTEVPAGCCSSLEDAGLAVMSDKELNSRLVFDSGNRGAHGGGHSHADALSVALSVAGEEVLTDPGAFVYVGAGEERRRFRSTAAHNTVTVDGMDQMVALGPFPWNTDAQVQLLRNTVGSSFTLISAQHDGYQRLPGSVIHERTVFHLHGRFWVVLDRLTGEGKHQVDVNWHVAPGLAPEVSERSVSVAADKAVLQVLTQSDPQLDLRLQDGSYSPVYGVQVPCSVINLHGEFGLPASIRTGLLVGSGIRPASLGGDGNASELRIGDDRYLIISSDGGGITERGVLKTDADFVCIGTSGSRSSLIACGVRTLSWNGEPLLALDEPLERFECVQSGLQRKIDQSELVEFDDGVLDKFMNSIAVYLGEQERAPSLRG